MERNDFEEVLSWQHEYQHAQESISRINLKQQYKDGLLIKEWHEEHHRVKDTIEEVSKIVHGLWGSSSEILRAYGIELMDPLLETMMVKHRIKEVDRCRDSNLEMIEQIEIVDRE